MATHKLYFEENYLFVTRLSDNVNVFHYPAYNSVGFIHDGRVYLEHLINANNHIKFCELISNLVDENDQPWTQVALHNALVERTGVDIAAGIKINGAVDDYTDLLALANPSFDALYYVRNSVFTGVWPFRVERVKGLWRYDGNAWVRDPIPQAVITEDENGAQAYDAAIDYYEGNLIYRDNKLQRANKDFQAKAFDQADWDVVTSDGNAVPLWKSNTNGGTYLATDVINYNGTLYKSLTGVNTDTTPDADTTNWEQTAGVGGSNTVDVLESEITTDFIYQGWGVGTAWQIKRSDRPDVENFGTATITNNPTHNSLTSAWAVKGGLNY